MQIRVKLPDYCIVSENETEIRAHGCANTP
jgi:hypothetical protein